MLLRRLLLISVLTFLLLPLFGQKVYRKSLKKHRRDYKKEHRENPRSPLTKKNLRHVEFYNVDPNWRLDCTFERTADAQPFDMATYSGETRPYVRYGVATCPVANGESLRLEIYQNLSLRNIPTYREHLFLPFLDATNGDATYGGGRYLDLSISDIEEGEIEIDFNKSYNPYCAYSDGYSCPIPPTPNHLTVAVAAGERLSEHFKH